MHLKIVFILTFSIFTHLSHAQGKQVEYHPFPHKCTLESDSKLFIMNNKDEFRKHSDCFIGKYPFRDYTLIGLVGTSGGCEKPDIQLNILKNDTEKKYIVHAKISSRGACRTLFRFQKLVYTYKFDPSYTIELLYNNRNI